MRRNAAVPRVYVVHRSETNDDVARHEITGIDAAFDAQRGREERATTLIEEKQLSPATRRAAVRATA